MSRSSFEGFPQPKKDSGGTKTGDATATAPNILAPKTAYGPSGKIVGQMPDNTGITNSISTLTDATGNIGANTVSVADGGADASLTLVILPQQGYYDGVNSKISIRFWGPKQGNIAAGTSIGWSNNTLKGTYTSDANATAAQILNGQTAYVNGAKVTGNIPVISADTAGGAVVGNPGRIFIRPPLNSYWPNTGYYTYYDDANFIAANIPASLSMFGLAGTGANVKRWATGTFTSTGSGIVISGLAFTPTLVMAYMNASNATYGEYLILANKSGGIWGGGTSTNQEGYGNVNVAGTVWAVNVIPPTWTASGVTLPTTATGQPFTWYAFE